ncbi:MAG: hypothetical protein IPO43_18590 [Rhodoferax sp.]|nr:hypothetical protein [Rhodoferax sp.]
MAWMLVLLLGQAAPRPVQAQTALPPAASSSAPSLVATKELPVIKPAGAEANANPYGLRAVWAQGDFRGQRRL